MKKQIRINSRLAIESITSNYINFVFKNKKHTFFTYNHEFSKAIFKLSYDWFFLEKLLTDLNEQCKYRAKRFLQELEKNGYIDYRIQLEKINAEIIPTTLKFQFPEDPRCKENIGTCKYTFSKFNFFTFDHRGIVLRNPIADCEIVFDKKNIKTIIEMMTNLNNLKIRNIFRDFIHVLKHQRFIQQNKNEDHLELASWEFHDLFFYNSTRLGQLDDDEHMGATYRFMDSLIRPENGFKNIRGTRYSLTKPIRENNEESFFNVLMRRRSFREYNEVSTITLQQLGAFLFYVAYVREYNHYGQQETVKRSFPSAGGLNEIEFYVLINTNQDLPIGLYYYHPLEHSLYLIEVDSEFIAKMNQNSMSAMGNLKNPPPVLIILSSRFRKAAWKYEKIAYCNTIKTVGTIFQTMYLVATALGLSGCALGTGDSTIFAQAIGVNRFDESSIGEFALGVM